MLQVATKIKNGLKTKMKNLRVQKKEQRRRFFRILKNLWRPSKIEISSKIFEESKICNLKSMYCEKLSDDIGLYKSLGYQMFSQFSSKESAHCWSIFLQNFFYKKGFFPKNLRDLWPKIFKASKILQEFEMDRRWRRRLIFGQKSSKNEDLWSFVATLQVI